MAESMRRMLIAITLAVVPGIGSAALIDVRFPSIAETSLGTALRDVLLDADTRASAGDPTAGLERVLVSWQGEKAPPLLQYRGLQVADLARILSDHRTPLETEAGRAYVLPRHRFGMVAVCEDEAAVATLASLDHLALPPWPDAPAEIIRFSGLPSDLRLDEWSDRISTFTLTMDEKSRVLVTVNSPNKAAAQSLMRWINASKPLLAMAAGVGVDKAQFPDRLVKVAEIERKGAAILVSIDLAKNAKLKGETFDFLAETLKRRMRKFAK
jgi:hypothetical protein